MDGCYASALGDCSSQLSNEHYISKAIVEFMQPDKGRILMAGPGGSDKPKGAVNLTSKRILCTKHNNELSSVDNEMLQLVNAISQFNIIIDRDQQRVRRREHDTSKTFDLDGALISRWFMKYGAGAAKAGVISSHGTEEFYKKPWLEVLFGRCKLPNWCGFTTSGPQRLFTDRVMDRGGAPPFCVAPLLSPDAVLLGAEFGIYPIEVFAFFGPGGPAGQENSLNFRPSKIILVDQNRQISVRLQIDWKNTKTNEAVLELRIPTSNKDISGF